MKIHIIQSYVFLLVAVLTFASCTSHDDEANMGNEQTIQIKFTMSMASLETGTRANTWGDNDYDKEASDTWESTIQIGRLQVLIYNTEDKYIGQLSDVSFVRHSDEENIYDILGSLEVDESVLNSNKLSCKLVVLANYDNAVPEQNVGTDISAIKDNLYVYEVTKIAQHTAYIPMWGVQKYDDSNAEQSYKSIPIEKGKRSEIGDIFMLRAMAKIQVMLSSDLAEKYQIKSASFSNYNEKGYVFPSGYTVENTKSLYYDDSASPLSFNPYTQNVESPISFTQQSDGSFVIYLPEQITSEDDTYGTNPSIKISLSSTQSDDTKSYNIQIMKYDTKGQPTGETLDLIRNTIYRYTISKIESGGISINYKVMPWIEASTNTFKYYFSSDLAAEEYKTTTVSDTEKAIAVTYGLNNTGKSPWLTLKVETEFKWTIHLDNPSFGFITEDNNEIQSQITLTGSQTIRFKLVPRQEVNYADANRNYRASVFVSLNDGIETTGKAPINSGYYQLPNYSEDEIIFYQVSPTIYQGLSN